MSDVAVPSLINILSHDICSSPTVTQMPNTNVEDFNCEFIPENTTDMSQRERIPTPPQMQEMYSTVHISQQACKCPKQKHSNDRGFLLKNDQNLTKLRIPLRRYSCPEWSTHQVMLERPEGQSFISHNLLAYTLPLKTPGLKGSSKEDTLRDSIYVEPPPIPLKDDDLISDFFPVDTPSDDTERTFTIHL